MECRHKENWNETNLEMKKSITGETILRGLHRLEVEARIGYGARARQFFISSHFHLTSIICTHRYVVQWSVYRDILTTIMCDYKPGVPVIPLGWRKVGKYG